jgi:hypothetical protein
MLFTHTDLQEYSNHNINLKREKVTKYREQVNRLRDNLADYIKENPEYGVIKMLHSGSVAKGTALKTINDMDVAVYVKSNQVARVDEQGILEYIRSALIKVYTRFGMVEDQFSLGTHCVKVSFKGSGLDVDVVPIIYDGGQDDRGYLINKDTGVRVLTSISLHKNFIRKRKEAYDNYAQMVRIIKWWRQERDFKMKSFLIELIWAHIADTEGIQTEIHEALKQFFRYIVHTELLEPIIFTDNYKKGEVQIQPGISNVFDPVNPNNNVAGSLDSSKRNRIVDEAEDALSYLVNSIQSSTKGNAILCLKQIFGTSFSY